MDANLKELLVRELRLHYGDRLDLPPIFYFPIYFTTVSVQGEADGEVTDDDGS